jgi:hypothetical protein
MPFGRKTLKLDKSAGPLRRFLAYIFHDWTREMPRSKRILTHVGILLQGYAFYSLLMWAFMQPKSDEWLREVPWLSANLLLLPRRPASGMLVLLGSLR